MSCLTLAQIYDFNENILDNPNPRLVGYAPIEAFRKINFDSSSSRIREPALTMQYFYDYNLEDECCDCDCSDPNDDD